MFERVRNPLSFFRKASSQTPKAGVIPGSQKETELRIGKPLRTKDGCAFSLLFPFLWGTGFGRKWPSRQSSATSQLHVPERI